MSEYGLQPHYRCPKCGAEWWGFCDICVKCCGHIGEIIEPAKNEKTFIFNNKKRL
jgi:hypothetical protein